jgi:hypothetical protein
VGRRLWGTITLLSGERTFFDRWASGREFRSGAGFVWVWRCFWCLGAGCGGRRCRAWPRQNGRSLDVFLGSVPRSAGPCPLGSETRRIRTRLFLDSHRPCVLWLSSNGAASERASTQFEERKQLRAMPGTEPADGRWDPSMSRSRPSTAHRDASARCRAEGLRVAQPSALGGIRAGVPLGADAGLPRRGIGRCGRFPNPPGGCAVGVISIRRQF